VTRVRRIAECAAINRAAGESIASGQTIRASKVRWPLSRLQLTRRLIVFYLAAIGKPARTSEIRRVILAAFPEATIYGAINELQCAGRIRKLSHERDALFTLAGPRTGY
jgi:hypothetical protein